MTSDEEPAMFVPKESIRSIHEQADEVKKQASKNGFFWRGRDTGLNNRSDQVSSLRKELPTTTISV